MKAALAGHADQSFEPPEGVTFVEIDPETGKLATPACPKRFNEAFIAGTEPTQPCELHHF
jgi:membrane carboxypeptidase/penicillin-binding protein